MSKSYRLKVRKIPLREEIPLYPAKFPPFNELYLDLIENKTKLKKNPPKPVFVREPEPYNSSPQPVSKSKSEDDFALKELEKAYGSDSDSDSRSKDTDSENSIRDKVLESRSERKVFDKNSPSNSEVKQPQQQPEPEVDPEELERQQKADYLFKFMVLKRSYPNVEIPDFTEHSDLQTMKRVYEQVIRRVSLDSSVETYKQYLVGGMMVMEWISVNWVGIDLGGFTQHQIRMANKYDRLLLELGEKNYSPTGSRFPVEVRLMALIVFNAGLFYVQKKVFSGGGNDIFNMMTGGGGTSKTPTEPPKPKRKMKGPTITPEDIENLGSDNSEEN